MFRFPSTFRPHEAPETLRSQPAAYCVLPEDTQELRNPEAVQPVSNAIGEPNGLCYLQPCILP